MVQWLRLHSPMQGVWVPWFPGWGAKIPHASQPENQNINNRSKIVTNSVNFKNFKTGPNQTLKHKTLKTVFNSKKLKEKKESQQVKKRK